jgi:hypothetical protein
MALLTNGDDMKKLMILVMALISNNAMASGEDLENCRWKNGSAIDGNMCAMFRKNKAADDAAKQRQAEKEAENVCDFPIMVKGKLSYKTAPCPKGEFMATCSKESIDDKGWSSGEIIPCPPGQRKTIDQIHREEESVQKRKCGKDYMTIRIGMAIEQLEDCHGASYVTETVSASGVVETYRTVFDWVYVKNGRVIGYTKRKF